MAIKKEKLENRIDSVLVRFGELESLLLGSNIDAKTCDDIMSLIRQSHVNEIKYINAIYQYEQKDKSDIDVPDFMKKEGA